jgi:2-desacetyl-2-hydroxyethyl bacteriochlorophyllide A dehydrogenase
MSRMRALVLTGPGRAEVQDVAVPRAGPGDVVVEVHRVGLCGTDRELFTGEMAYLASGRSWYPLQPGHEWSGVVREIGDGVDAGWLDARVTGDTMLACGTCDRCLGGRRHVCRDLVEVGISLGCAGALAERLRVPAASLHRLPDAVDDTAGALVEPGGNAWRAAAAAHAGPGSRVLVWGGGTIGLLAAAFAAAAGAEVHLVARHGSRRSLAARFGVVGAWVPEEVPGVPFHAMIDATDDADVPAAMVRMVEPGGRAVCIGLAGTPSTIDTRDLALRDVTAVGLLSGSPGLAPAIEGYALGAVDPRPLVTSVIGLDAVAGVLMDPVHDQPAPKVHVDPRA